MAFPLLSTTTTTTTLPGVPKSAEALAIAELLKSCGSPQARAQDPAQSLRASQDVIYIAQSDRHLESMRAALSFFVPNAQLLSFPAWDCMPYDRASPRASLMETRIETLAILAASKSDAPRIILTTASAIVQKLPPKSFMQQAAIMLAPGQSTPRDMLVSRLLAWGYRRAGKAMEPGEFALRGSIVDIVAPGMNEGVRIDYFGDDIETLRPFDPLTQITKGTLQSVSLHPVSEVLLNEETTRIFRTRYRELFGAVTREDPLYESVSQQRAYPGMEHWLPLFYECVDTLFDYCEGAMIAFDAEAKTAITERHESILDYYQARQNTLAAKKSALAAPVYHALPPEQCFLMESAWEEKLSQHPSVQFSSFSSPTTSNQQLATDLNYKPVIPFAAGNIHPFDQLRERVATAGKSTLLACFSTGSRERLTTLLAEREFHCIRIDHWSEIKNVRGKSIGLAVLPLESGFETDTVLILSEQDVLGERIIRTQPKKKKPEMFLLESANFAEGELVTHKEHGIGRFEGLVTLTVLGAAHDCLKLIYDGGKLFLPVENIEMLTRFGLDEEGVQLDKLGSASWQARKAKLKERIKIAAEALLKTAAERKVSHADAIDAATGSYEEFCARFPFVETEDQARAIDDVLADLRAGKPMDRLICGDVGFGKTEVALRAAFAVVSQRNDELKMGRTEEKENHSSIRQFANSSIPLQVALIAPTTLLARQHYRNFKERFEGFPVVIRQLSRLTPARQQKEIREKLKTGEVDIVIGTHALLSKQVEFKHLALLIIDEEQHFGVGQKEKLKSLKSDIHVLTLTATPIPRTLQMALSGVRELSLIATPPVDRLAVRSFVMPFDPVVVREAILREMHRGGKTFAVTPRIKDMAEFKLKLSEMAPEAKIAVAHGQMAPAALDDIMNEFYDGKYDILLSTAIIESGLDVRAANTILIDRAHLFGLSQLYQLRGRVGRGKQRAYAYFLLPHQRELTHNATRRLEVMQTLDTLGAGFTLASHDMDIRGFGNLVGEEQSGHIREVGIELYQQMLEEAVEGIKRSKVLGLESKTLDQRPSTSDHSDLSPAINLGLSVLIPESYVEDLPLRLGLYRRAAGLSSAPEIDSFAAELVDRFGAMPEETTHLIDTLGIKILCKSANIERIDCGPKGAVIAFKDNLFANPDALIDYVGKHKRLKIRADQKLIFAQDWDNPQEKLTTIKKLAGEIAGLTS